MLTWACAWMIVQVTKRGEIAGNAGCLLFTAIAGDVIIALAVLDFLTKLWGLE